MPDDPHNDLLYLFAQLDFLYMDHIGRRVYQCRCCQRVFTLSTAITSYTIAIPGVMYTNPQRDLRTPIPPAYHEAIRDAMDGDDGYWQGVNV